MRLKNNSNQLPAPSAARAAKGLTQRALAALVPTTQATVNACEREGVYPKHRALRAAYLAALGLTEPAPIPAKAGAK